MVAHEHCREERTVSFILILVFLTFACVSLRGRMWHEGLMHGVGTLKWSSGVSFKGPFVHGRIRGKGIMRWPGGNVYDGEVVDGHRHGEEPLICCASPPLFRVCFLCGFGAMSCAHKQRPFLCGISAIFQ